MVSKSINRYKSFVKSLTGLEQAKGRDMSDDFVLSGTVQKFNLTFDISWKVMKDIVTEYYKILDFAMGSPREVLKCAASVKLIKDDMWMKMLDERNAFAHDYDGDMAKDGVSNILEFYIPLFVDLKDKISELGIYKEA